VSTDTTYVNHTPPPARAPRDPFFKFVAALVVAVVVTILAVFLIVAVEKPAPVVIPKAPVTRNIAQEWTACMFNQNTTTAECNKIVQGNVPADTYIAFSQCFSQGTDAASYLLCLAILPTSVTV
jgi:hypothetical protein